MSWIKVISYDKAGTILRKAYDRVKGPNNYIDNVFLVHSLRPKTLLGHMHLYKNTIHNPKNSLPKWYLEAIGVFVSHLNGCHYCIAHHSEGFKRLYPDPAAVDQILLLENGRVAANGTPAEVLTEPQLSDVFGCSLSVSCSNGRWTWRPKHLCG